MVLGFYMICKAIWALVSFLAIKASKRFQIVYSSYMLTISGRCILMGEKKNY